MNSSRCSRALARGFTLIELLITVTILATALAVLMPSVTTWVRNLAVRSSAESIRAGIEKARLEALRRNVPMGFWLVSDTSRTLSAACTLSSSGPSWVVSGVNPAGKCQASPSQTDDPLLVEKWSGAEVPGSVQVAAVDANGAAATSVSFNSLGQAQTTGTPIVRIDITSSTAGVRGLRVMVQAGGSVRMCDPNVDSSDPRKC